MIKKYLSGEASVLEQPQIRRGKSRRGSRLNALYKILRDVDVVFVGIQGLDNTPSETSLPVGVH